MPGSDTCPRPFSSPKNWSLRLLLNPRPQKEWEWVSILMSHFIFPGFFCLAGGFMSGGTGNITNAPFPFSLQVSQRRAREQQGALYKSGGRGPLNRVHVHTSQASGTAVTALGSRCTGPLLNTVNCHSHLGVLCCNTGLPGMLGLFNFAVCLTWWRWLTLFCMYWLSQVVLRNTFRHTRVCLFRISAFPPCVHDLNERLGRPASFYLLCCGLSLSNSIVCCGVGVDCSIVLLFFLMGGGGDAHWTILFSITPNVICLLRRSTPLLISTLFLSLY